MSTTLMSSLGTLSSLGRPFYSEHVERTRIFKDTARLTKSTRARARVASPHRPTRWHRASIATQLLSSATQLLPSICHPPSLHPSSRYTCPCSPPSLSLSAPIVRERTRATAGCYRPRTRSLSSAHRPRRMRSLRTPATLATALAVTCSAQRKHLGPAALPAAMRQSQSGAGLQLHPSVGSQGLCQWQTQRSTTCRHRPPAHRFTKARRHRSAGVFERTAQGPRPRAILRRAPRSHRSCGPATQPPALPRRRRARRR